MAPPTLPGPTVPGVHTPWGRADLAVEPGGLRVRPSGGLDLEERGALSGVAALGLLVVGALVPEPFGWLFWLPALVLLVVVLVVVLLTYVAAAVGVGLLVGRLVTRRGRRGVADEVRRMPRRWQAARDGVLLPVGHLVAPPSVHRTGVRARLVLPLRDGPVELEAWSWRADGLDRVAAALDHLARGPRA